MQQLHTIAIGDIISFQTNGAIIGTSNGAITTASKNLTVDTVTGTIAVGQRVLGAGISDGGVIVKVATVTSQTAVILDTAITVADDVLLEFTADTSIESKGEEYEVTAVSTEL